MQSLPSQFNNYDVLAYLIPGFIALLLFVLFLSFIIQIPTDINAAILIFSFIPLSYVAGIIFHEISNIFEMIFLNRPSKYILLDDCDLISEEEKKESIEDAKKYFHLDFEQISDKYSNLIYNLFRSALKENANKPEFIEAELFNVHYGLYRNLFGIFSIYSIGFILATLCNFHKIEFILIDIILLILSLLMYRRANRFSNYHVRGIFRSFLQSRRFPNYESNNTSKNN